MRRRLPVLLTTLTLGVSAVLVSAPATTAATHGAAPDTIKEASEPYRWVNEGGPYGGPVSALTVCAAAPDVLYATTPNGVFKSTNGATTWQPTAALRGDGRPSRARDVAVDPREPGVVYAADSHGVYKSTDGGASWRELKPGDDGWRDPHAIEIDPKHPDTVYVVDRGRGVFKSTDRGRTWKLKNTGLHPNPKFDYFGMDPRFPHVLYGVTSMEYWQYTSQDDGATWHGHDSNDRDRLLFEGFKQDPDDPARYTVAFVFDGQHVRYEGTEGGRDWKPQGRAPSELQVDVGYATPPNRVLVFNATQGHLLCITTDGGDTWRTLQLPPEARDYFKALRVGGERGEILYLGTNRGDYYFSDDDGQSWELFYSAESDPDAKQTATLKELRKYFLHGVGSGWARKRTLCGHGVAVDPSNPAVIYWAQSDGVLRTDNHGRTWLPASAGIAAFETYEVVCDSQIPGLIYAVGGHSVLKSTDGSKSWRRVFQNSGHAYRLLAVHPLDPKILLLGRCSRHEVRLSTDGGETWNTIPSIKSSVDAFVFDPKDADTFYVLTSWRGIFKTTDRGRTWNAAPGTVRPKEFRGSGAFPPPHESNAEIIYLTADQRKLLRSTDLGETWEEATSLKTEAPIKLVHVHPHDPKFVIVAERTGRLRISRDAGATWRTAQVPITAADGDWDEGCLAMHSTDYNVFYVGGYDGREGILRTRDGGKTFEALDNGLPHVSVLGIAVSPADGAVYAATLGAGVYRLVIEERTGPDGSQE